MKKQIQSSLAADRKLNLNKRTISNLQPLEMNKMIGGLSAYCTISHGKYCGGATKNGNTCYGHKTCYTCV